MEKFSNENFKKYMQEAANDIEMAEKEGFVPRVEPGEINIVSATTLIEGLTESFNQDGEITQEQDEAAREMVMTLEDLQRDLGGNPPQEIATALAQLRILREKIQTQKEAA
jgi:hypothetical protein